MLSVGWIDWAYALRALGRVEEAKAVLLEAYPAHGNRCATLNYNLACYFCVLGDYEEAKNRLRVACKLDEHFKKAALDDKDLQAIWEQIAAMK